MIDRFLEEADVFHFACQTTGDCCRQYAIYCTPYDVARLRAATGRTTTQMLEAGEYEVVEESFSALFTDNAVGALLNVFGTPPADLFPVARLTKAHDTGGPRCGFLTDENLCGVYAHRPGVCRSYPLGRVRTPEGPRWFERAYNCPGKGRGTVTVADWIAESGLEPYACGNDRFAAFADAFHTAGWRYAALPVRAQADLRALLYDFDRVLDTRGLDPPTVVAVVDEAARRWLDRLPAVVSA